MSQEFICYQMLAVLSMSKTRSQQTFREVIRVLKRSSANKWKITCERTVLNSTLINVKLYSLTLLASDLLYLHYSPLQCLVKFYSQALTGEDLKQKY